MSAPVTLFSMNRWPLTGMAALAAALVATPMPIQSQDFSLSHEIVSEQPGVTAGEVQNLPTPIQNLVPPAPGRNADYLEKVAPGWKSEEAASNPSLLIPPLPNEAMTTKTPPAQNDETFAQSSAAEWTVQITPLEKAKRPSLVSNYESVYKSIPYRRAEYLANPSYRHDTTVEILFGQMRSMVINRNDTPQRVVNPRPQLTQPYPLSKGELYSYWPLLQYGSPIPLLSPIQ